MKKAAVHSIFFKTSLAYGFFFALILGGVFLARYAMGLTRHFEMSRKNVDHYLTLLVAEIGTPPDFGRAASVVLDSGLEIAILGPETAWGSDAAMSGKLARWKKSETRDLHVFFEDFKWFVQMRVGPYRYVFTGFHSDYRFPWFVWVIIGCTGLAAIALSYFFVRRLLNPVRVMSRHVQQFGVDGWKYRLNLKGRDELALLGNAMDDMAARIERYILSTQDLLIAVSHELRSPLTRMKLVMELSPDENARRQIGAEIRNLECLVADLIEERRLSAGSSGLSLEPLRLHEWLETASEPYRTEGAPVTFQTSGPNAAPLLDRARMNLLVSNLVGNALKYAPGSRVNVLLCTDSVDPASFSLRVSDEGPGIPDELLARIGEPFLLAEKSRPGARSHGGYGLGLSIVRAIADAHGATFLARNVQPHGFSVEIRFRPAGKTDGNASEETQKTS